MKRISPEDLAVYAARLEEGWSYVEIQRTYGVNRQRLARRFPGRGWTNAQRAAHGVMVRQANRINHQQKGDQS